MERRRYLEFEQSLAELDEQIAKLKNLDFRAELDLSGDIRRLEEKSKILLKQIFTDLKPYQVVQLSRHPDRPNLSDYIKSVFDEFLELHGDRAFRDDPSIVGGLARLDGRPLMLIGHHKGKSTQENMSRNFGMPRPEGYRKALRLMKLAERWKLPVVTFVDTPGAYPGLDAEERGQAEAIAQNIFQMCGLKVPIISVVVGEGGSGGALALAVCDRLFMFQYSIYSVISPEGCAAITWKDGAFAARAAEALKITASQICEMGIADRVIEEPLGGAHRDPFQAAQSLKAVLLEELDRLSAQSLEERMEKRYERYRRLGQFEKSSTLSVGAASC